MRETIWPFVSWKTFGINLQCFLKQPNVATPPSLCTVKVTAAIGSLKAQIYTLNHEIDPSSSSTARAVCGASLATSAVIITFRMEEGDTFSVRSANFRCGDVIDAMEIAAAANSARNRMTNQKIADDKPLPTRGVTIPTFIGSESG